MTTHTRLFLVLPLLLAFVVPVQAELSFDDVRDLPLQHRGRVKPMDTLAREMVTQITGRPAFSAIDPQTGQRLAPSGDPVDTLLSMIFQADAWKRSPAIRVKSNELKHEIGLDMDRRYFSFNEIQMNHPFHHLVDSALAKRHRDEATSQLESKSLDLLRQMNAVQELSEREVLVMVPPHQVAGQLDEVSWSSILAPEEVEPETAQALRAKLDTLREAYVANNNEAFVAAAGGLRQALRAVGPQAYPADWLLNAELHYNQFRPFHNATWLCLIGALAFLVAMGVRHPAPNIIGWVFMSGALLLMTHGFILRTVIGGRAPVSNMYESMVFVAWGIIFFALIYEGIYRQRVIGLASCAATAVLLWMSHTVPIDTGIGVLVPVLRSDFWLVVHVQVIVLSYSAFTIAWALAHILLIQVLANPENVRTFGPICNFIYRAIQIGVILLAAGTILGGVWAQYSWGRFWGWDPKETWALISLLGYMAILHARMTNWIGNMGMAMWSIIAFMLVIMCYYGVNFVLPVGMHSYGAGAGGGLKYAIGYVVFDTIFVGAAALRWHLAGSPRVPLNPGNGGDAGTAVVEGA